MPSHDHHKMMTGNQTLDIHNGSVPSVAFDDNGRLWATWIQGDYIYVNYSNDEGKTFSSPVTVNSKAEIISSNSESRPNIAVNSKGHILVSYIQKFEKRFTGFVRFSRSIDGGKSFSTPLTVNDNLDMIGHSFATMVLNEQDDIFISWLDSRDRVQAKKNGDPYTGSALYYAHSDNDGINFSDNLKLADGTCQCCRIAMAIDQKNLPVTIWRHIFEGGIRDHAILGFETKVRPKTITRATTDDWQLDACPHHGPALSIDQHNTYHMVWFTQGTARKGSFYAHSTNAGQSFSAPVKLGANGLAATHPVITSDHNNLVIAWKTFDGEHTLIQSMNSQDKGTSWNEPYLIAQTNGASDHPFLIQHHERTFLSWHSADEGYRLIEVNQSN